MRTEDYALTLFVGFVVGLVTALFAAKYTPPDIQATCTTDTRTRFEASGPTAPEEAVEFLLNCHGEMWISLRFGGIHIPKKKSEMIAVLN